MVVCERCKKDVKISITSVFNTDMICLDCFDEELKHPLYSKARRAVQDHIARGIFNFPGIGLPKELQKNG